MFRFSAHVLSIFQYKDKGKDCLLVLYRAYHKSMNINSIPPHFENP